MLLGLGAGVLLAGAVVLYAGFYNVGATHQHFSSTFYLMKVALRESVERRARRVEPRSLEDPALARRGLAIYRAQCVNCHGAPGVAPDPFALGMNPAPTNLAHGARTFSNAELYWIVKNGIKMTGMPAWEFRLSEDDLWSVVAFMRTLPRLSSADYRALVQTTPEAAIPTAQAPQGAPDARRGKDAIEQYACATCHAIPGTIGEHAPVGPPLTRIAQRRYLGGVVANTPENLVQWLRAPQKLAPGSAMPNLGVTERDARDIAAYLLTLK
jgi:mono/diheme cytochrome c family protein